MSDHHHRHYFDLFRPVGRQGADRSEQLGRATTHLGRFTLKQAERVARQRLLGETGRPSRIQPHHLLAGFLIGGLVLTATIGLVGGSDVEL